MPVRNYASPVRVRHAEDTRRSIIDAARDLFVEHGYSATSVAAVASAAGVAVTTVYASVGGKPALILSLARDGDGEDGSDEARTRILALADPREILRAAAISAGDVTRRHHDTLSLLIDNRTTDPAVAAAADHALHRHRERLAPVAARLDDLGALRPELTGARAEQILWFYLGTGSWRTLRTLGWSWSGAGSWLTAQATHALLT
jgi:AcrR family transcriptional regulator